MPTQEPKRCPRCKRAAQDVTTDGVDLYFKGERVPLKPLRIKFPCPWVDCDGSVLWNSERDRKDFGVAK